LSDDKNKTTGTASAKPIPKTEAKPAPAPAPKPAPKPAPPEVVLAAEAPKIQRVSKVRVKSLVDGRCRYGTAKFVLEKGKPLDVTPEQAMWLVRTKRAL